MSQAMAFNSSHAGPGGFLHETLPSLPLSTITSSSIALSALPSPRAYPLKPGSPKESSFIEYVDRRLLDISGRYEIRFNLDAEPDDERISKSRGYGSFTELATDLDGVVDIIWVSGTRKYTLSSRDAQLCLTSQRIASLQIPYLLNVALSVSTYMPSFDFAPRRTFQLLQKLDVAFSSLLHGQNVETGDALPGFEGGRGKLTTTDKVRLRGLVERTRVAVVMAAAKRSSIDGLSKATDTDGTLTTDDDTRMTDIDDSSGHDRWEMEIARVYERTLVDLGAALDMSRDHAFG